MDLFDDTNDLAPPIELPKENGYSFEKTASGFQFEIPNGELFFAGDFFDKKISDRSVEYFLESDRQDTGRASWNKSSEDDFESTTFKNINWKQDTVNMYGKLIPLPRLTSWYGDPGKTYSYSGIRSHPNNWNKGLLYLKKQVETIAGENFNSVLLNWYRNGDDHLTWHADDEKELGDSPIIASVNFGTTRDFVIRRKDDHLKKITIPLAHGSLLVMSGQMQEHWEHSVPKRKKVFSSRFNLTFRKILD